MRRFGLPVILIFISHELFISCSNDFLDVRPGDELNQFVLANEKDIDALLTGAYSLLDGVTASSYFRSTSAKED
jgi:hypothetical protein